MTVFISYSHDSAAHKDWVRLLASSLVTNGVDVVLDQWDLRFGDDLPHFMERSLNSADRVLVICTAAYVEKADHSRGGVGYEKAIVSAELLRSLDTNKFIPVVRSAKAGGGRKIPLCLGTRLYIDFCSDTDFNIRLEELLREIHSAPKHPKPQIGQNPFPAVGPDLNHHGRELSEALLERLAAMYRSRKQADAPPYTSMITDVYQQFEVVHQEYLSTFKTFCESSSHPPQTCHP